MEALGHLARNAAFLAAADVVARLAGAAFVAVAARRLGAEGYGLYATALTFLLFARVLGRFGLQGIVVVRDVAEQKAQAARYLSSAILLALPPSVALWPALPWVASALDYEDRLGALLAVLGAALLGHALARPAEEVLRAFERMAVLSAASILLSLGTAALGVALLMRGFGLDALMRLQVVAAWVEAGILLALVHRHATAVVWRPSWGIVRRLAREGLLLFVLTVLDLLSARIDILILARARGPDAVGLYVPALRILEYVALFRAGAGGALFPFLAARWRGSPEALGRAYQDTLRLYVAYAVGSAVALTLGAEAIVGVLFGSAYLPGALTLQILAWAMVADLCAGPFGEVIFVSRQPLTRYIPAMAGLAGLNLALNLWLAPRWSHVGAAVAALVTALTGLAVRTVWVRRLLEAASPSLPATLWRPALAALGMAGTLVVMRPAGFWLALLPAGLVYGALLVVTGAVRLEEIARATRAIGWRRLVGR